MYFSKPSNLPLVQMAPRRGKQLACAVSHACCAGPAATAAAAAATVTLLALLQLETTLLAPALGAVLLVADQYVLLNRTHMHATFPACHGLPTSLAFTRLCAAKAEWTNPIPDNSPVALIGLGYTNYNRLRDPTVLQQVCGVARNSVTSTVGLIATGMCVGRLSSSVCSCAPPTPCSEHAGFSLNASVPCLQVLDLKLLPLKQCQEEVGDAYAGNTFNNNSMICAKSE